MRDLKDNQVQIVGVSYGSLLSSIITVLDANDANILTAGTTLISPPLNFRESLKRIDYYIDETVKISRDVLDWKTL